ncbi:MAG TPA: MFS transporter [Candidatus Saccharimonadales bacterium]|nr:MFS transporter [Candidatus Saccharimonadales bacterium]
MLVGGVVAGFAAGIAFGGDWRRLATFSLQLWPLLAIAAGLRIVGILFPVAPLAVYVGGLAGVAIVALANWRIPGAALIAVGTALNVLVVLANSGMPYDVSVTLGVGAALPSDSLHVILGPETQLRFLADIIPVGVVRGVYSVGDLLIAVGGFLIPFILIQPDADASAPVLELRSPNFAFFWLAQVISRFGDPITLVALTFITYRATGSAFITALAVVIATIPNAVFGFFGGAIADAVGHRRAMLWCDLARALLIATIPLLLLVGAPLVLPFAVVLLAGMCGAIFNPARIAIIPSLLAPERLAAGNSLVYASDRAIEIGGALAGGLLVATVGEGAFYIDAVTFALSAVLLARVSVAEISRRITVSRVWADAREGLRFLRRSTVLWSNTVFSLAAQVSNPVINGLSPVLVIRRFADNDPHLGAVEYGAAEAAIAFGAVLGSAVLPRYLSKVPKGRLLVGGFAATGIVIGLIAVAPTFPFALALFFLLGLTNVIFYVPMVTIFQEETPANMRGRVFGARSALTNLSWLPIILVSGVLADAVGPEILIAVAGGLTLTTALVATRVRAIYGVA